MAALLVSRDDDSASPKPSPSPTAEPSIAKVHRVSSFSGAGSTTTKTFSVAANWELRWTAEPGSSFRVELLKADGTSRGELVRALSKSSGSTFVGEPGTFKLKVTSKKAWTVQVFSQPPKK